MANLSKIEAFFDYAFPNKSRETVQYGLFSPGSYEYLLRPSARSLQWLAGRVDGDTYRRYIGVRAFETLASFSPSSFTHLPGVSQLTLSVPAGVTVDVTIFGMRIKILDFQNNLAYTLPLCEHGSTSDQAIASEVAVRRGLPGNIRVPLIRKFDDEYPYVVETLVQGDSPTDVVDDWPAILDGLQQLKSLYRTTTKNFVNLESVVNNAFEEIDNDDQVFKRARDFLKKNTLPDKLRRCRVHGDYQTGNLLVNDGKTCILDWESSRIDLCLVDCFDAFKRHSIESKDGGPLAALVKPRGSYRDIANDIAKTVGPIVYGEKTYYRTLPIVYLIHQFAKLPNDVKVREHFAYDLLQDVLNDVGV